MTTENVFPLNLSSVDTTPDLNGAKADVFEQQVEYHMRDLLAREEAKARVKALTRASAPAVERDDSLTDEDGFIDWEKAFAAQPENPPWIVEPFLMTGRTHALWAEPGAGKSLLVLETVVNHIMSGRVVVYIDSENHIHDIVDRLSSFGYGPADLKNLRFRSFEYIPALNTPEGGQEVLRLATVSNAEIVVIDTTSRFVEGSENDANTFLDFYRHTLMLLKKHDISSLRLDHPGKDASRGTRGSSAKYGDIDFEWQITDEGPTRTLTCTKNRTRHGLKKGETIILRKHGVTEDNPCFWHEWDYRPAAGESVTPADPQVRADIKILDDLGLEPGAGRKNAKALLAKKGVRMGTERLSVALRERNRVPDKGPGECPLWGENDG